MGQKSYSLVGEIKEIIGKHGRLLNYEACKGADALVINTEWNEYRQPDFNKIKELMTGKVIFDGRNLYKPDVLKDLGLKYFGVGIGN